MRSAFISKKAVQAEIREGFVRISFHPIHRNLAILNYTPKAQFSQHWNPTTMRCRGLVVEWRKFGDKLPIVIDSPRKFFNNGEPQAPDLTQWKFRDILLTEKLDGYYISLRNDSKYGLIVTSRGSFDNKYVGAARALRPADLPKDVDFFCELCQTFPGDEGIIVAKYPDPELVCWGVGSAVPTESNKYGWTGKIAKTISEAQFESFMLKKVEGVVAYNTRTGERVKIKTKWYLDMHRLISNCTFSNVFVVVSGGGSFIGTEKTSFIGEDGQKYTLNVSDFPEEHLAQMQKWEGDIHLEHASVVFDVTSDYALFKDKTRKEYALESDSPQDIKSVVFAMMGKKDHDYIEKLIWKVAKNRLLRNSADQ